MTKRDFMKSFNEMRVAFRHPVIENESAVYLDHLSALPYISEVMYQASEGILGLDNRFIPNVPQLIEAHDNYEKEVERKARQKNADKFGLPEGSFVSIEEGKKRFRKYRHWMSQAPNGANPFRYAAEMEANDALKT